MDVWLSIVIHVSNIEHGPEILKTLRTVGISDINQVNTNVYITCTDSKFKSFVKMYHKNHSRSDFTCTVAYDIGEECTIKFEE